MKVVTPDVETNTFNKKILIILLLFSLLRHIKLTAHDMRVETLDWEINTFKKKNNHTLRMFLLCRKKSTANDMRVVKPGCRN